MGALSLWLILRSLGCGLLEEDPEAMERNRRSSNGKLSGESQAPLEEICERETAPRAWLFDSERARLAGLKSAEARRRKREALAAQPPALPVRQRSLALPRSDQNQCHAPSLAHGSDRDTDRQTA